MNLRLNWSNLRFVSIFRAKKTRYCEIYLLVNTVFFSRCIVCVYRNQLTNLFLVHKFADAVSKKNDDQDGCPVKSGKTNNKRKRIALLFSFEHR